MNYFSKVYKKAYQKAEVQLEMDHNFNKNQK